jgi:hypothetical protein
VSLISGWWTVPSFFGTSARSSHSGKPRDTSFCQNPLPPMPAGYRSSVTGRPQMCGTMTAATDS